MGASELRTPTPTSLTPAALLSPAAASPRWTPVAAAARSRRPAASLHLKTSQVGESSRRASLLLYPLTPAAAMAQSGRIGRRR